MTSSSNNRKKIFICYSHADYRHLERLQIHLADYVREKLIDVWDDTKIAPGAKWHEEMKNAIETTNIAVLLVSADFLASQFIAENELPPLLTAAQAIILPVIVSPCSYKFSELSQFQAVNSSSKTLTKMNRHEREELWNRVANIIRDAAFSQKTDEQGLQPTTETPIAEQMTNIYQELFQKEPDKQQTVLHRYSHRLSRKYPALFIVLIDQSGSMAEPVATTGNMQTKANIAAAALNNIIYEVYKSSGYDQVTGDIRGYAYISVLGYSDKVNSLLGNSHKPVSISTLAMFPKGIMSVVRTRRNSSGDYQQVQEKRPFWITPYASGSSDMIRAFEYARDIILEWLPDHKQGFPPVIINITDAYDSGSGNLLNITHEIQQLRTDDGSVLICNCHFSKDFSHSCIFPTSLSEVQNLGFFAPRLFEMSSLVPERLRERAAILMQKPIEEGARSLVYNADPSILVQFLNWGTLANLS